LEAQPAQDESEVSLRICSRDMLITSFLEWEKIESGKEESRKKREGARLQKVLPSCFPAFLIDPFRKKGGEDRNRTYLGR
jgi:hypothetical protein